MHKKFIVPALLLSFSSVEAATSYKGGAELLNEKAWSVTGGLSLFSTTGHYDLEGNEVEQIEGNSFSLLDADFSVAYGVNNRFQVRGMARFRNLSSETDDGLGGVTSESSSGPESVGVEARYRLNTSGATRYALGVHYTQTLYKNEEGTTDVVLGDSGGSFGANLYMTHNMNAWKLDANVGYRSPGNDLSDEIVYNVQALYNVKSFDFFAGVDGVKSLERDEFSDDPFNKPNQNTGGSYLFNSINREWMAPYAGLNYQMKSLLVTLKGQTVMGGISTDKGHTLSLGVTWQNDGVTTASKKIGAFKEYHVDGAVLKISTRGNFVRIDQGLSTDVEKGMKFDIYQTDYFGGNELVATGVVFEIGADWSIIKLLKKYKDIQIKPGFAARGY